MNNQPKQQQLRQQKQMAEGDFTIEQVVAQQGILATAQLKAFNDAASYINKLKTQVAAGNPVTQAQLNSLGSGFTALITATNDFDVTNSEPVGNIPPLPPVVNVP